MPGHNAQFDPVHVRAATAQPTMTRESCTDGAADLLQSRKRQNEVVVELQIQPVVELRTQERKQRRQQSIATLV